MLNLVIFLSLIGVAVGNARDRLYYEQKFKAWIKEHAMHVESDGHYSRMLENFSLNDDIIETHNSQNHTFALGHNQFSHMSQSEWKAYLGSGLNRRKSLKLSAMAHETPADISSLPESVDWVAKGGVTPVKNQGQCGSCWSFSTTGALEGAHFNKYGVLQSFSEQNLVDCDNESNGGEDQGCNGGLMDNAFTWVQKNGGLCHEEDYPYVSGTTKTPGVCGQSNSCSKDQKVAPKAFVDIEANSDAALMSALAKQPVSVAIDASQSSFQLYKSGVYSIPCDSNLDHGVLAVGYGVDAKGQKFYKVKNSWGTGWGEGGYIRLARGVAQKEGQCGILSLPPSYPVL